MRSGTLRLAGNWLEPECGSSRMRAPRCRNWVPVLLALTLLSVPVGAQPATTTITLDQAIDLALTHNHSLLASRSQVSQAQADEITANLRPNPTLGFDSQFIPIFSPGQFSLDTLNFTQQFDVGFGYTFERGKKRQRRLQAARDITAVTRSQVADAERSLVLNVGQEFINALLAKSNLDFAQQDLASFQQTVNIGEERYKAGDISEGDFLKIKLQLLQFQTDVSNAKLAKVQALSSLRQLLGYDAVPQDYDVAGDLEYAPLKGNQEDYEATALRERPDLKAAQLGVTSAQSQILLAKANGKQDLDVTYDFSHVSGVNSASLFFNIGLPIFNRNQGEIARTRYALNQVQQTLQATSDAVMTDVMQAYQSARTNEEVVQIYLSGNLKTAQESRDISEYAYKRGAASLLDFLDSQRSYRATELAYRQAVASYMNSVEELKAATGTRKLP